MLAPDDRVLPSPLALLPPDDLVDGAGLDDRAGADDLLTPPSALADERAAGARVTGARVEGVPVLAGGVADLIRALELLAEGVTVRVRVDRVPERVDVCGAGTARVAEPRCPGETARVRVSPSDDDGVRVLAVAAFPAASADRMPRIWDGDDDEDATDRCDVGRVRFALEELEELEEPSAAERVLILG